MSATTNLPADPRDFARDKARVNRGFWPKFKALAGRLPFAEDLLAALYCARDPASPRRVRMTLMAALAYFVVPSDVIPDVFVSFGFTDDAAVLFLALQAVAGAVTDGHRKQARETLAATTGARG